MKIITGSAKGMNLETLEGDNTRPTSQRVKEAIFSMIQFDIEGACVLDLFAGSGQLGLEALSRGAKRATFCDSSREATDIVIRNAKKARLFDRCRISTCDYMQMIRGISGKEQYDIIFIDPPYKQKCIADALEKLCAGNVIGDNAIIVCESGEDDIFGNNQELKERFDIQKQSKYSISYVTVLRPRGEKA
ncbi:MAG: 16S rRNA (guanine(966)-N(2))-methyltransferase RsmD [Clostridia bacterium]|nr:16S rRNA (guanine(966)-N(2))-methyltransferase RsmD [Clostridia bacterium]